MTMIKQFFSRFISFKAKLPSLTVVGVGPGDPRLLTISAVKAIKKAKVIAFPISGDDKKSVSAEIVKNHIKFKKKIPIIFPMARKKFDSEEIWSNAVDAIVGLIQNNESVVLLCLGDPSLYASASNILRIINNKYPAIKTNIVPGISSISAAAALSNFDLVAKGETLIIKECPSDDLELLDLISVCRQKRNVLVLMKVGYRWVSVKNLLKNEDLITNTVIALNVGMTNQIVQNLSEFEADLVPYFSLILIRFEK